MTSGEQAVWAAAFVAELDRQRATGVTQVSSGDAAYLAARAVAHLREAVVQTRTLFGTDSPEYLLARSMRE